MDGSAEGACALAVNDPHLRESPALALSYVFRQECSQLRGPERVQVEHSIDRLPDRLDPGSSFAAPRNLRRRPLPMVGGCPGAVFSAWTLISAVLHILA